MRKRLLCDVTFGLEIELDGPMLIRSGIQSVEGTDMGPVLTYRNPDKPEPYVPGTTIKGVLRSHFERVARTLRPKPEPVCLPYEQKDSKTLSCGKRIDRKTPKPKAYADSCPACRLFGSMQFRGRTRFDDAYAKDPAAVRMEVRDGVGIDRRTGGAARGVKYDYEVVVAGTFATEIGIENFEAWQVGALGLALRDLTEGRIRFGLATSRGLGRVKARVTQAELRYPITLKTERFVGIDFLASDDERKDYALFRSPKAGQLKLPSGSASGLWDVFRYEGEGWHELADAARDELIAYVDALKWDRGLKS